ncbi:BRO-N domain-containing protein [Pseudomonas extremaustralis]
MARIAEKAGDILKRRNPGLQARVSGNEINYQEENVMSNNSTAASNVIPFRFEAKEVRSFIINEGPWFVASDVTGCLGYVNSRDAISKHVDADDRNTVAIRDGKPGNPNQTIINESGLYALIFGSDKAEAKRFKKWVTAEVLPAIRKHGRYEDATGQMGTLIGETIGTSGFNMLGALIKGKVVSLPPAHHRKATAKIWSQTHAAFGVRSAADIPASQLDAARNFVAAYVLEGEWLGRATAPAGTIVSKGEMLWINSLIVNAEELSRLVVQHGICDHLREVGSPIASSMTGRTLETQMSCNQVRDSLGAALEAASAWASRVCDAPIKRLA